MAATTTVSAWSKPGAWALDAEENEAELLQDAKSAASAAANATGGDFPSLSAAAATKQKKKKQTLSLAEFSNYSKPTQQQQTPIGRNDEDLLVNLPKGPRERSAEELERNKLGGGFKNYGDRNNRYGEENSTRWGSSRVSDEGRRSRDSGREREFTPSRADEIDNWAAAKKSIGAGNGFERRERGFFTDSQSSKADEVDSWVSNKTYTPSSEGGRRFTGGFEKRSSFDSLSNGDRRGSFDSLSNGSGADSDSWGKRKSFVNEESISGGRPKLVLQPRTLPIESKEAAVKAPAKAGNNPFGAARPREEVLKEKGVDLNEIEKKFEAVKVAPKEEKPEGRRGGFGNGWSNDKGERAWRKPQSTSPASPSSEKIENGDSVSVNGEADNGHVDEN